MSKLLSKILPFLIEIILFFFIGYIVHEYSHAFVANELGYFAVIKPLKYWVAIPYMNGIQIINLDSISLWQDLLVKAMGGFGCALVFLIAWAAFNINIRSSPENLDEGLIFGAICLTQTIYGLSELLLHWSTWLNTWCGFVAPGASILIVGVFYYKRLFKWWKIRPR